MKVLVTGGTGFIGVEVVRQLARQGHQPVLLARDPQSGTSRRLAEEQGSEVRRGNVLHPETLRGAGDGIGAILHLVGIISEVGEQTFERVHVRATENVLDLARAAGVRRYVQMSALGTRSEAKSRYHQTKWQAEELVRRSGLDFTIFRPSLVYGARDHFVNLYAGIIRWSPVVPLLGRSGALFQPIAVEEVARAFVASLEARESIGQNFDLCGPERLTLAQIVDQVLEVMSRKRLKVRIPAPLARMQAAAADWFYPEILGRAAPLNPDQLAMLEEDNVGDPSPAAQAFGLQLEPFRSGIAKYLG